MLQRYLDSARRKFRLIADREGGRRRQIGVIVVRKSESDIDAGMADRVVFSWKHGWLLESGMRDQRQEMSKSKQPVRYTGVVVGMGCPVNAKHAWTQAASDGLQENIF